MDTTIYKQNIFKLQEFVIYDIYPTFYQRRKFSGVYEQNLAYSENHGIKNEVHRVIRERDIKDVSVWKVPEIRQNLFLK